MNSKSLSRRIAFVVILSSLFVSCDDSPEAVPVEPSAQEEADARTRPLVLLGGTQGLFKASALGETLEPSNKGLSGNALIVQGFLEEKSRIYAATKNGVYVSKNDGKSWTAFNHGMSGAGLNVTALFKTDEVLYAGTFGGGVYVSTNKKEWNTLNSGLTGGALVVRAIIQHNGDIYIGTHDGVYSLNDSGTGWQSENKGQTSMNDLPVVGLASVEGSIYAATFAGFLKELRDGSSSWTTHIDGLPDGFVNAVAVVGNELYVGTNNYGVFTYDGSTFVPFTAGLPSSELRIRAFAVKGNRVLMSTINGGTYYTIDGTTWVANSGEVDNADYWGVHLR